MKTRIKTLALSGLTFSLLATFIASCGNKENQAPIIVINEPSADSTWRVDSTIHIEASITDDESLHEMSVLITNGAATVYSEYPTVHDVKSKDYHEHVTIPTAGNYTLTITAEDHDGLQSEKSVPLVVVP